MELLSPQHCTAVQTDACCLLCVSHHRWPHSGVLHQRWPHREGPTFADWVHGWHLTGCCSEPLLRHKSYPCGRTKSKKQSCSSQDENKRSVNFSVQKCTLGKAVCVSQYKSLWLPRPPVTWGFEGTLSKMYSLLSHLLQWHVLSIILPFPAVSCRWPRRAALGPSPWGGPLERAFLPKKQE